MAYADLRDHVCVVTGGNQGLGEAFCHGLAEAGGTVVVAARDVPRSRGVVEDLEAAGATAVALELDATSRESVEAMHTAVLERFGRVDVLVNNAGTCVHRPALEVSAEEWRQVLDLNLDGVWHCCQVVGGGMVGRGSGAIVNVGSISALIVNRPQRQPGYNASKAAVHQLTKSLAVEWAESGVRVNAVAPGYVRTAMAPVDDPEFKPRWIDDAPMQRAAEPAEIAPVVVFLAGEGASFMTGEIVVADGGYSLV